MRTINIDALRKATSAMRTADTTPSRVHRSMVEAGLDPRKWYESEKGDSPDTPPIETLQAVIEVLKYSDEENCRKQFPEVFTYIESIALVDDD